MAPTQRIPGDYFGERTEKGKDQATQISKIALGVRGFLLVVLIASWSTGCANKNIDSIFQSSFVAQPVAAKKIQTSYLNFAENGQPSASKTAMSHSVDTSQKAAPLAAQKNESVGSPSTTKTALVAFQTETNTARAMTLEDYFLKNLTPRDQVSGSRAQTAHLPQDPKLTPTGRGPAQNPMPGAIQPIVADGANGFQSQLTLSQVLQSVQNCYPEIKVAISEIESANGKVLASWGEFDTLAKGHSISQPLGFYQTYRNGAGLYRPLFGGGEVYGTYRIGDGDFEPWFGERETNEAGELKAGFSVPLAKNRIIDARRAKQFKANAQLDQIEANVGSRLLRFERFATQAYWDWVASGKAVKIQSELLQLAQTRVGQIQTRIESGDLAKIAGIDNDRFIAKRKNDLIKAQRALEKAAIKLSLFLRDQNCSPVVVSSGRLPQTFPTSQAISNAKLESDIRMAIASRPEPRELAFKRNEALIDLQYAQNLTMAKVDLKGFAGQDLGGAASSKGDKTPFELQLGLYAEVPLQRREGSGKIQAAQAKLKQIESKTQFVTDKIRAEVQDAASAVNAALNQIEQSRQNLTLTRQSLELGKTLFEAGDIDLIKLNIYETSVSGAQLQLLDAQFKYFYYDSVYKTAINQTVLTIDEN